MITHTLIIVIFALNSNIAGNYITSEKIMMRESTCISEQKRLGKLRGVDAYCIKGVF